jgi:pilus assembly protein Flp/PilA
MSFFTGCAPCRLGLHAHDDRGATAVEYGLMAALIAVAIVVGVTAFGSSVKALFEFILAAHPFG